MDTWDDSQMPPQRGRVSIVTGANQGIGFECARQLAEHGAHVVLACRHDERARAAVQQLRTHLLAVEGAGAVEYMLVDIGCMASVKLFADAVNSKFDRVDILINSAGVGVPPEAQCTDGYPIQFGVNYLGHFYLTTLLFGLLKKSTAARVVGVSSPAHRQETSRALCRSTKLDFTKLYTCGDGDWGWTRYEKSKLMCIIFANELDRRLKKAGISNVQSLAAQPGLCHTNIFNESIKTFYPRATWGFMRGICSYAMQSASMGSLPLLYAATGEGAAGGEFYGPNGRKHWFGYPMREVSAPASHSEEYGLELWKLSESLTKTSFIVE